MMINLGATERKELIGYYKRKAVNNVHYETVARCVHMVEELTKEEDDDCKVSKKQIIKEVVNKFTDIPLTYHYNTANKIEYRIDRLHTKDGHLICRGRPLKLTIPQILSLKETMQDGSHVLETQKDWVELSKQFGINWMALQRYCYNLDIGTFDKWIQKFMDKHNCQTTLEEVA